MISLMLSSSSSGFYWPEKWEDQFETHCGSLTEMEAQRVARPPRVKRKGLKRPLPR